MFEYQFPYLVTANMAAVVPARSGTFLTAVRDAAGALWSCARQEKCVASKQLPGL